MTDYPDRDVVICECFCRDGLQHEPSVLPVQTKANVINKLTKTGFKRIEATSYSNPKVVPQFADASELLKLIDFEDKVYYKGTCPNVRAVQRAIDDRKSNFGVNEISFLVSASESHSLKNLKRTIAEQRKNIEQMADLATGKFRIIGTVSVAFGCPFEGRVSFEAVLDAVKHFYSLGIKHITLGDTTGMATPKEVMALYKEIINIAKDIVPIAHFHDSRGTALINNMAAFDAGVRYFDSAIGGVGGHPHNIRYGGGYTGNACTEDLVNLFESCGIKTGIDLDQLMGLAAECEQILGRKLNSHVALSGWNSLIAR